MTVSLSESLRIDGMVVAVRVGAVELVREMDGLVERV